jgi:tripartite-type tricarboxylate transporter receptor subunit TctC
MLHRPCVSGLLPPRRPGRDINEGFPEDYGGSSTGALAPVGVAEAQDYPTRSITWIAPSSPGGGFDVISRVLAPKLSEILGQSVVVQNIAGAGATIGAAKAAEAAPDGYTILLGNANHTMGMSLYKDLESFDPIVRFADIHRVIVSNPDLEAKTFGELVALAKEKPGQLNAAHSGVGSPTHICLKLLKMQAEIDFVEIPYEGGGQAIASVVSGETDMECLPYASAKPFIDGGQVRALAVASKERIAFAPDIPTAAEILPDFEGRGGWYGALVPKGTPEPVRAKIGEAIRTAVADPTIRQKIMDLGMNPIDEGPEAFASYLKKEVEDSQVLVERAGLQPQ